MHCVCNICQNYDKMTVSSQFITATKLPSATHLNKWELITLNSSVLTCVRRVAEAYADGL